MLFYNDICSLKKDPFFSISDYEDTIRLRCIMRKNTEYMQLVQKCSEMSITSLDIHVHTSFLPWSVSWLAMPKLILHLKVDLNRIPLTMCAYTNTTMNDRWLCFQSKRLEHLDHDHSETWVGNHCTILVYYSIAFDLYSEEKGRAIKRQHDLITWQSTPISLLAVFHLFVLYVC